MTITRLYRWKDRLVRAAHPSQVIAHVALDMDKPKVATQADLEELLLKGVKPEEIKALQQELSD